MKPIKQLKSSVPTSYKTHHYYITKTSWLVVLRDITAVYCENDTKSITTVSEQNADTC
jgi:hypothetical protein